MQKNETMRMDTRPRILIVDDEPMNVDYLEQELDDLGYETRAAYDGSQALVLVAEEEPDLILLDIMMPVMDGFAVCRQLKENEDTRLIPIIIMTALNDVDDRVKGIEAGADDFLTKPVDERELRARIKTALRLKETVERKLHHARMPGEHFAKFVPEAVKRLVMHNPSAPALTKRDDDISVLFVDIVGYTKLSQILSAEELNRLVERYFSVFLDRIHDFGGDISGTSGDGLMVTFENADPSQHAITAVETALALFDAADVLNAASAVPPLQLHVGINSGIAAVGSTRYEGAHGARWVFTADGFVPILASRLAAVATAGQILVGQATADRIRGRFAVQWIGRKELKNVADAVDTYAVHRPGR